LWQVPPEQILGPWPFPCQELYSQVPSWSFLRLDAGASSEN
jgi:hypothetical protein